MAPASKPTPAADAAAERAADAPSTTTPPAGRSADPNAEKAAVDDPAAPDPLANTSGHPVPAPDLLEAKTSANPLGVPEPGYVVPAPALTTDQELAVAKHDDARAAATARGADPMIEALEAERAGYVAKGLDDRVAQVDEQLALRRGEAPKTRRTPASRKSTT